MALDWSILTILILSTVKKGAPVGKYHFTKRLDDLLIHFGRGSQRLSVNVESLDAGRVNLDAISKLLQDQEVYLEVVVGEGRCSETVWGCDLTKGYIEENAFYTT